MDQDQSSNDKEKEQKRIYDINQKVGYKFIEKLKNELAVTYKEPKVLLSEFTFDKGYYGNFNGRQYIRDSACDTFYIGALTGNLEKFKAGVEEMLKAQEGHEHEPAISENGSKIN